MRNKRNFYIYRGVEYKINTMTGILALTKIVPGMVLGAKSLIRLEAFVGGALWASQCNITKNSMLLDFDFAGFEEWIAKNKNKQKLSIKSFGIVRQIVSDDELGFDRWYKWYYQYQKLA